MSQLILLKGLQQCVQCKASYKESENSDISCKFHSDTVSKWGDGYSCCNRPNNDPGCQSNKHQAEHHTHYKYEEFFTFISSILNDTNISKQWTKIEADLEIYASVGFILSTSSNWQNSLYIILNSNWNFITFSVDTIKNFGKKNTTCNDGSNRSLIKEIIDSGKVAAKAEWAFKDKTNDIIGVYLSVATTNTQPESVLVRFSVVGVEIELDEVVTISIGDFTEYRPSKLYHNIISPNPPNEALKDIPIKSEGVALKEEKKDDVNNNKKNWKSYGSLAKDVMVQQTKLISNKNFSYLGDKLSLLLTFQNKCDNKDFVFTEIEGIYQLNGDIKWSKLDENNCKITVNLPFIVKKGIGSTTQINVDIWIAFSKRPLSKWRNASYLARFRSLNIKLKFNKSLLFETIYCNNNYVSTPHSKDNVFDMIIRECLSGDYVRFYVDLEKVEARDPHKNDNDKKDNDKDNYKLDDKWSTFDTLKIGGNHQYLSFDINEIRKMVYNAIKQNKSIIKFDTTILNVFADILKYNAYGYIDAVCNRLYAIKLVLTTKAQRKTGFYVLPIYGSIHDVDIKDPLLVTSDYEIKYFKDKKSSELESFKMDDIVETYFDIEGVDNDDTRLVQKIQTRDIDLNDFEDEGVPHQAQQAFVEGSVSINLKKQLQLIGNNRNIDYNGNGGMNKWANNVANKFEELTKWANSVSKLFASFPRNNNNSSKKDDEKDDPKSVSIAKLYANKYSRTRPPVSSLGDIDDDDDAFNTFDKVPVINVHQFDNV